ncbi:hypothetical protein KIN20_036679 [Parelaphostrongylus tenuis]|uniref:Uncharacterized protein n=1 Tax=Parelaphostrongylus tenuis TaxID=148309 RepID=A0AAD5RGL8_PARTN|nr:hypothetical protein KIN20_036679 [Parelaphostrongylus tenuis]
MRVMSKFHRFFARKSRNVDDSGDNCITLAEDTPQSQMFDSAQNNTAHVSFVRDSASPSDGSTGLLHQKPANLGSSNPQNTSSVGIVRRKKQRIFDVNMQPLSHHSTVVFAEDTQNKVDSSWTKYRSDREVGQTSNDVTCVQETCERTMQSSPRSSNQCTTMEDFRKEVSSLTSTTCQNKQVSALLHNQPSKLNGTSNISVSYQKPALRPTLKKTNIYDGYSAREPIEKNGEVYPPEKNANSSMNGLDVANMLKLVSSGKRYDDMENDTNTAEENGIDIARVVAKLNELVHYVDIERQSVRAVATCQSRNTSMNKCPNFKRFRKASQGKFNASLASTNISCIISGNNDLVDFRQLPHMS